MDTHNVKILKSDSDVFKESEFENINISSIYNLNKINNLFKILIQCLLWN